MTHPPMDAAEWWAKLSTDTATSAERAEFDRWLQNDANKIAYEQVTQLDALFQQTNPDIDAMMADTLRDSRTTQVRRWTYGAGIAAAAACAIFLFAASAPKQYATAHGERRDITLADGSKVTLDQDTRIAVSYSWTRRAISLAAGRAAFDVAKNPSRPFVVSARDRTVTALGTMFDVGVTSSGVSVTLSRGVVAIADVRTHVTAATLAPGQNFTSGARGATVQAIDVQKATAWRMGKAIFEDDLLSDAVGEINAYAKQKIVLSGGVRCARITGVFDLKDPETFVAGVASDLELRTVVQADNTIAFDDPARRGCEAFGKRQRYPTFAR